MYPYHGVIIVSNYNKMSTTIVPFIAWYTWKLTTELFSFSSDKYQWQKPFNMSVFSLPPAKSKEDKYDTIISALSWNDLATQQGRMQSIIRCSIPLHESIYLLFLPYIYLHIYHMVYGPAGQSKMSWTYSLHYVWHFITHPCPSCMLLAILRVLEKQFT